MSIRSVLTAIALAAMAMTATSTAVLAAPAAKITEADRKEFREAFSDEGGVLIRAIIAEFPAEYRAFEDMMLAAIASDSISEEEAGRRGFEFARPLSEKLFEGWKMAPDAEILAATRADTDTALGLAKFSQQACAEMFEGGLNVETALALPEASDDLFERQNASRLRLAKSGRAARITRAPLTDAEIESVLDAYVAGGGDIRWLAGQSSGDFKGLSPTGRCASGKIWSETILDLEPAMAARFLTSD